MKTKDLGRRSFHVIAKIVCFFMAVLIWLYVMWVKPPKYDCYFDNIPVAMSESASVAFSGEFADSDRIPTVCVYATKAAMSVCTAADITAYVSLDDLGKEPLEAGHTYLVPVHFDLPDGMEVRDEYHVSVLLRNKT